MSLSERIKLAMDQAGMSQVDLARAVGIKPPSINGWLSGKSKFLRGENLLKAARALQVNQQWLATGDGDMKPAALPSAVPGSPFVMPSDHIEGARPVRAGLPETIAIPRVKLRLRAGVAQFDTEPDLEGDGHELVPRELLVKLGLDPRNLLALRVRGISMEPMMFEDDVVVVDKSSRSPINRELFAVNFDGEACIKQMIYRGGEWYLYSINPDFGPVNVKSGQCSIVGRVVIQPTRVLTGRL
jgi:phage repressor protein C with HTH and peptisase S24 domain